MDPGVLPGVLPVARRADPWLLLAMEVILLRAKVLEAFMGNKEAPKLTGHHRLPWVT